MSTDIYILRKYVNSHITLTSSPEQLIPVDCCSEGYRSGKELSLGLEETKKKKQSQMLIDSAPYQGDTNSCAY